MTLLFTSMFNEFSTINSRHSFVVVNWRLLVVLYIIFYSNGLNKITIWSKINWSDFERWRKQKSSNLFLPPFRSDDDKNGKDKQKKNMRKVKANGAIEGRKGAIMRCHKQTKPNYVQSIYFSAKGKTPIISVYSSLFIVITYFVFKCHNIVSCLMQMPVSLSLSLPLPLSFSLMFCIVFIDMVMVGIVKSVHGFSSLSFIRCPLAEWPRSKRTGYVIHCVFVIVGAKEEIAFDSEKWAEKKYLYFIHTVFVPKFFFVDDYFPFSMIRAIKGAKRDEWKRHVHCTEQRKYLRWKFPIHVSVFVKSYNQPWEEHRCTRIAVGRFRSVRLAAACEL